MGNLLIVDGFTPSPLFLALWKGGLFFWAPERVDLAVRSMVLYIGELLGFDSQGACCFTPLSGFGKGGYFLACDYVTPALLLQSTLGHASLWQAAQSRGYWAMQSSQVGPLK